MSKIQFTEGNHDIYVRRDGKWELWKVIGHDEDHDSALAEIAKYMEDNDIADGDVKSVPCQFAWRVKS